MNNLKFYIPVLPLLALCLYVMVTGNRVLPHQWISGLAWMILNLVALLFIKINSEK